LGGAKQQDCLGARGVGGKSLVEKTSNQMTQGAEPAQYRCRQAARQGAIAIGKRWQPRVCVLSGEKLVERNPSPQDAVENIGGNSSGCEAGDLRLGRSARTRHTPIVAGKLCPGRELREK
jgi:hypothetical protein